MSDEERSITWAVQRIWFMLKDGVWRDALSYALAAGDPPDRQEGIFFEALQKLHDLGIVEKRGKQTYRGASAFFKESYLPYADKS